MSLNRSGAAAGVKASLPATLDPNVCSQSPGINNGYPFLLANPPLKPSRNGRAAVI